MRIFLEIGLNKTILVNKNEKENKRTGIKYPIIKNVPFELTQVKKNMNDHFTNTEPVSLLKTNLI